jgi:hypothetical protein
MKIEKKKMQFYTEDFTQKKSSNNTEISIFHYRQIYFDINNQQQIKKTKSSPSKKRFRVFQIFGSQGIYPIENKNMH